MNIRADDPPLWRIFGRFRRYLLTGYLVIGMLAAVIWFGLQVLAVLNSPTPLTPAAATFFAGFTLLIVLVVLGIFVAVVATEDVAITEARHICALLAERDKEKD